MASIADEFELFDSLSPYEIAVWTCSSLPHEDDKEFIVLPAKDSFVWAGAVAHILLRRPGAEGEQIRSWLREAIMETGQRLPDLLTGRRLRRSSYVETGYPFVEAFLRKAGVEEGLDVLLSRTENAMRSLEWRGLIEDPFRKKLRGLFLAVLLVMPVNYSNPGPNTAKIESLTWEYAQRPQDGHMQREFRIKVRAMTEAVMKDIVPAFEDAVARLAMPKEETLTTEDAQKKLASLGYYRGKIDGIAGPQTVSALRQFQRDKYLEETGFLDRSTIRQLHAS